MKKLLFLLLVCLVGCGSARLPKETPLTEARVKEIIESEVNKDIGEMYVSVCHHIYEFCDYHSVCVTSECSRKWIKFTQEDINDKYDSGIKINDIWYDKQDVIYYDDRYKELRKEIEERIKEKEKK